LDDDAFGALDLFQVAQNVRVALKRRLDRLIEREFRRSADRESLVTFSDRDLGEGLRGYNDSKKTKKFSH